MGESHNYAGREQSYVKHILLNSYLQALIFKTASVYPHFVYVDGFAGPWQSKNEKFEDTSFGIALKILRQAKDFWKETKQRDVRMSAFLIEKDPSAYQQLMRISARYPDMTIRTYNGDFLEVLPTILDSIPQEAFTFFLIDPKGWKIRLKDLHLLLARRNSEVLFNFMFDFINRAASIKDPLIITGLNELIPFGNWRSKLTEAEQSGEVTPDLTPAISSRLS